MPLRRKANLFLSAKKPAANDAAKHKLCQLELSQKHMWRDKTMSRYRLLPTYKMCGWLIATMNGRLENWQNVFELIFYKFNIRNPHIQATNAGFPCFK